ncbi:oxidoreductase [Komagataeibacter medellinensis]|uniref:Oxidoreductase n=1 Tax=Komagataeibacter medellinensis TaxID=1177712 RepID=A0ABQ6VY45_9PROT|nr:oxidoreductase [Komagataeibacter medellinensis]KAB8125126.1 oxidoreductase [Komagataeibacter medellinensis]
MIQKTALVTGGSSGIGAATARQLKAQGFIVYAVARHVEQMASMEAAGIHILPLDITDELSLQSCVETILAQQGRIDILVNNAGYGSYGAVEDVSIEEARRQFEVNLFGLARLTQLILPKMRESRFGRIVNVSSIGGKIYTPFGAWYHATKHALEGWSDCLRIETKPFGIDVIVVEPGGIRTSWSRIAVDHLRKTSATGPYAAAVTRAADGMTRVYASRQLSDPSVVATTILKAIGATKPKTRYHVGYMARTALTMRWLLSDRMFDRLITSRL